MPASTLLLYDDHNDADSNRNKSQMWRNALRSPPTYKIGNRTFRLPNHLVLVMALLLFVLVFFYLISPAAKSSGGGGGAGLYHHHQGTAGRLPYNAVYPLTPAILRHGTQSTFRIAIVADLDTNSKSKASSNAWLSYLKMGYVTYNRATDAIDVSWDSGEPATLSSGYALKGERMRRWFELRF